MVAGVGDVAPGDTVTLALPRAGATPAVTVVAHVRWAAAGGCGLRFAHDLSPEVLRAARRGAGRLPVMQRLAWDTESLHPWPGMPAFGDRAHAVQ